MRSPKKHSQYRQQFEICQQAVSLDNVARYIGTEFELQDVRLRGVEECVPCYWMNAALAPGAEMLMKGRGGLRAAIVTGGCLHSENK